MIGHICILLVWSGMFCRILGVHYTYWYLSTLLRIYWVHYIFPWGDHRLNCHSVLLFFLRICRVRFFNYFILLVDWYFILDEYLILVVLELFLYDLI